jgi:Domain of unknown function (DUF1707)
MHDDAETRCSDADREAVAEELRRHAVAGRLDVAELEERLGHALQARTRRQLHATLERLPTTTGAATLSRIWAAMPVVTLLVVALWATGRIGEDAMLIMVAAAILVAIWRRSGLPRAE